MSAAVVNYLVGDIATISVTFTGSNGSPVDPTNVSLVVMSPDGARQNAGVPPIVKISTGIYTYSLIVRQQGIYNYQWKGTGTNAQVYEGNLLVEATGLVAPLAPAPNDFITLFEFKNWIESFTPNATTDDYVLQFIISGVSQDMLTRMSRETIELSNYQEWYDGTGTDTLFLDQWPITSIDSILIGTINIQPSQNHITPGYVIDRGKRSIRLIGGGFLPGYGMPYYSSVPNRVLGMQNRFPHGVQNIFVSYNSGFASTPVDLAEACLLICDQEYKRRGWTDKESIDLPEGGGSVKYRAWEIPPRAQMILSNYTRTYHP